MIQLSPDDILDIADHAVRSLIRRNGYLVRQPEFEDMTQSAVVRVLEVDQTKITGDCRGYLYRAAYRAAFDWLWWWDHGKPYSYCRYTAAPKMVVIDEDVPEPEPEPEPRGLTAAEQARLAEILLMGRRRRGARGAAAARREAQIVNLLMQGYESAGICQELGLPYTCVNSYRQRIRQSLRRYIDATGRVGRPVQKLERLQTTA